MEPCLQVSQLLWLNLEGETYHVADLGGSTSEEKDDLTASVAGVLVGSGTDVGGLALLNLDWSSRGDGSQERDKNGGELHIGGWRSW